MPSPRAPIDADDMACRHLPQFDVADTLEAVVAVSPALAYASLSRFDLGQVRRNRLLFWLRDLPAGDAALHEGMQQLAGRRLPALEVQQGRALAVGLAARLWRPRLRLQLLDGPGFAAFARPGFCRVLWQFSVAPAAGGCRLRLHCRVQAHGGRRQRAWLKLYWRLGHPLSAAVRRAWLHDIAAAA